MTERVNLNKTKSIVIFIFSLVSFALGVILLINAEYPIPKRFMRYIPEEYNDLLWIAHDIFFGLIIIFGLTLIRMFFHYSFINKKTILAIKGDILEINLPLIKVTHNIPIESIETLHIKNKNLHIKCKNSQKKLSEFQIPLLVANEYLDFYENLKSKVDSYKKSEQDEAYSVILDIKKVSNPEDMIAKVAKITKRDNKSVEVDFKKSKVTLIKKVKKEKLHDVVAFFSKIKIPVSLLKEVKIRKTYHNTSPTFMLSTLTLLAFTVFNLHIIALIAYIIYLLRFKDTSLDLKKYGHIYLAASLCFIMGDMSSDIDYASTESTFAFNTLLMLSNMYLGFSLKNAIVDYIDDFKCSNIAIFFFGYFAVCYYINKHFFSKPSYQEEKPLKEAYSI